MRNLRVYSSTRFPVLDHVEIQNFRCLRDVRLELEPLTILVGPNASGKSTVLDALDVSGGLTHESYFWQFDRDLTIHRTFVDSEGHRYERRDTSSGHDTECGLAFSSLFTQRLELELEALRRPNQAAFTEKLQPNGGNLTNMFASLSRQEQEKLCDEFCRLVPVYSDVNERPEREGYLRLAFEDRWSEVEYTAGDVSDGTMLIFAYLVLQYQEKTPDVLTIEEPERGLHPYLLENLLTFLRDLATGKHTRDPFNIVLATHSPQLLEYTDPEEVRLLDRDPDTGETRIEKPPVDDSNWDATMEQYLDSLGEAWLSGGLGGVPGRQ